MASYNGRARRSSMPALSVPSSLTLASSANKSKVTTPRLKKIVDEESPRVPKARRNSLDATAKRKDHTATSASAKGRRHSVVAACSSPSGSKLGVRDSIDNLPRLKDSDESSTPSPTNQDAPSLALPDSPPPTPTPKARGRRHSVACVGATKELTSILKKSKHDPLVYTNGDMASRPPKLPTWTLDAEPPSPPSIRRGSLNAEADIPEGSDIFRSVMAQFLPEEDDEEIIATKIATVKLKGSAGDGKEEVSRLVESEEEDAQTPCAVSADDVTVKRIRWNEHVDVIR